LDDKFLSIPIEKFRFCPERRSLVENREIVSGNGMEISSNDAYFPPMTTEAANNGEKRLGLEYIIKVLATDPRYSMALPVFYFLAC
jgi:hypothetical protein